MFKKIVTFIFPHARQQYALLRNFWKHKSLKPQKVFLPILNNALYLNWDEPRGRAVILGDALGQPDIKKFWVETVQAFKPDVVIDCGVNYGEIIFYCGYSETAQIIGIEADKALMPFIKKSRDAHPNKNQISLYNAFVSDKSDAEISFYVDKRWSGRSSAFVSDRMMEGKVEEQILQTISIDSLLGPKAKGKSVLFKIDVEGYEPFVLRGMTETIAQCEDAIGIIEFNNSFFNKSGIDVEHFIKEINKVYDISLLERLKENVDILTYLNQKDINTDIILSKKKF